jgi:hypothetical protein
MLGAPHFAVLRTGYVPDFGFMPVISTPHLSGKPLDRRRLFAFRTRQVAAENVPAHGNRSRRMHFEDAEVLARYGGLVSNTNAFNAFVQWAMAA